MHPERRLFFVGLVVAAACAVLFATGSEAQIITTVAGGGPNNIAALNAGLFLAFGVATDAAGNVFITSFNPRQQNNQQQHRVFRVDTSGLLTVLAGDGTLCPKATSPCGDGGPATSAKLNLPTGVIVDHSGNIYVADLDNARIRKVDASGTITTVAGNGMAGFSGDNGPATSAELNSPEAVALDRAGNLYIADFGNQRIRRVDTGGIITTVAGNGNASFSGDGGPATSAQLNEVSGIAVDGLGNLFVADTGNQRIRKVDTRGVITTVAGNGNAGFSGDGGPATNAALRYPYGVAVDGSSHLLIADSANNRIREVDASGTISTLAGNGTAGFSGDGGPATGAQLRFPTGMAVGDSGELFIADAYNFRVRKVNTAGTINTLAGNGTASFGGDGSPAPNGQLSMPQGIAVDGSGNLFIADTFNDSRVRKVNTAGIVTTFAGNGKADAGGDSGDGGPATDAGMNDPVSVAADSSGNVFITEVFGERVRKVDTSGIITTFAGNGISGFAGDGGPATNAQFNGPWSVAVDSSGNLFVADTYNNRIRKVDKTGTITTVAGNGTPGFGGDGGPATKAELNDPFGVVLDSTGNLFIADTWNFRVRKVDRKGIITTVAGNGIQGFSGDGGTATGASLNLPVRVAVDSFGNLFIADDYNARIRRVDVTGIITTVAGNGTVGFSGDAGPATSAQLGYHTDVAVDSSGNLFVADSDNNRIRFVPPGPDFAVSSKPPSSTVRSGQYASYTLTVTPIGDVSGNQTISLTCSEPVELTKASCTVAPSSVTLNGPTAKTAALTVTTTAPTRASVTPPAGSPHWFLALLLPILGFVLTAVPTRSRESKARLLEFRLCYLLIAGLALQTACGGGGANPGGGSSGTPPGTYTINITGSSGSLTHSTKITLTVQ